MTIWVHSAALITAMPLEQRKLYKSCKNVHRSFRKQRYILYQASTLLQQWMARLLTTFRRLSVSMQGMKSLLWCESDMKFIISQSLHFRSSKICGYISLRFSKLGWWHRCMGHNRGWEEAASMFSGATVELKTCNAALLKATGKSWDEVSTITLCHD